MKALPAANAATLLRALFKCASDDGGHPLATLYELARLDESQIARYNAMFGYAAGTVPLTYGYLLAQRAHVATMLDAAFPFRLIGVIHADNTLERSGELHPGAAMRIATQVEIEPGSANGARCCRLHSEAIQHGAVVFSCASRYLARRGKPGAKSEGAPVPAARGECLAAWQLAPDAGRRYAAVSGDWNPIDLWNWSARLMGLPAAIIHGMHTVAMSAARLEQAHGDRITKIAACFRKPLVLGARVELYLDEGGSYRVRSADANAVEGEVCFD